LSGAREAKNCSISDDFFAQVWKSLASLENRAYFGYFGSVSIEITLVGSNQGNNFENTMGGVVKVEIYEVEMKIALKVDTFWLGL